MAISFVGSTSSGTTTNTSTYTISKPSGITTGDVMFAFVAPKVDSQITINLPTGWTRVTADLYAGGSYPHQMAIMMRVATASEPSSWSGTFSQTVNKHTRAVVAYRGATGTIAASSKAGVGNATSFSTGSASNPASNNWRITAGSYQSASANWAIESNEVIQREDTSAEESGDNAVELGVWDSNGPIAIGSFSRTISRGATWSSAVGWMGFLDASDVTSSGTLDVTLPFPTVTMAGDLGYSGSMAAAIPSSMLPTFDNWSGIATPPSGTMDIAITPVMDVSGTQDVFGTVAVAMPIPMSIVGETRLFGIRTVVIEAERRGFLVKAEAGKLELESISIIPRELTISVTLPFPSMTVSAHADVGTEPITVSAFPLDPLVKIFGRPVATDAVTAAAYDPIQAVKPLAPLAAVTATVNQPAFGGIVDGSGIHPTATVYQPFVDSRTLGVVSTVTATVTVNQMPGQAQVSSLITAGVTTNSAKPSVTANAGTVLASCHN